MKRATVISIAIIALVVALAAGGSLLQSGGPERDNPTPQTGNAD